MRFGSVCSGIEAASVAWHPLGWEAAWLSEIEPFPCAVLKHHYPDVPNYGDMTLLPDRILSGEVEAPDLFCGGTPCQAFSVAGLRNSLDDARGNLSLTFVGIANAIDHVRSVRRVAPAIIFWENVPGVLNTKDNAFGCFLGALAGEIEPVIAPGDKWSNAGCVYGPQRTVAWRVLDAQYFGVAQRRRRVFVVASARDDINPTEILFEFEGVRRDTAPSRKEGQRPTANFEDSTQVSSPALQRVEDCGVELSGPLSARDYKDAGTDGMNKHSAKMVPVMQPMAVYENHPADSRVKDMGEVCSTVVSRWGTGGGNLPMVSQPIAFTTEQTPKFNSDQALTLTKQSPTGGGQPQCVAQPFQQIADCLTSAYGTKWNGNASATNGSLFAAHPTVFNIAPGKGELKDDIHVTDAHVSKTIDASGSNPAMHQGGAAIVQTMAVRRLTPIECERLQGFPDNYTNIPWRKASEAPDGPRYKALGNSWAVPVVRWIGKRIQERITT
jgi:DNA (cytosine-5)-methyltransferase 1